MSIEGQGHFFTIYFPGFVCFVLYLAKISGERLQDHWSSGYLFIESRPVLYLSLDMRKHVISVNHVCFSDKGAYQLAHIGTLLVYFLDSIIVILSIFNFSIS